MDGFNFSIPQFEDYLYYWHITTPFGSITAPKGFKEKEDAEEQMKMVACKIVETVFEPDMIKILPVLEDKKESLRQEQITEEALRKAFDPDHIGTL